MAVEDVTFPMVGKVMSLRAKVGDTVEEDQTLATFESMKIEMELIAPCSGTLSEIVVSEGQIVEADDLFGRIEQ